MQGFRDALDYCGLRDIGYNGYPFTWCNRRPGHHNVWVRLDREVVSVDWMLKFPTTHVHHLEAFYSDHRPHFIGLRFQAKEILPEGSSFQV